MSIRARIVVSVALQEVDNTPNAKSGSESDNECLQYVYCAVEKCHIKLLSAALRLPEKGHKKRRSVFDNCRGHKSPRCVISAARRYSVVRVRLPAAIRARSRGAYHVARVYCFYFKLPPFQKVVCRQAGISYIKYIEAVRERQYGIMPVLSCVPVPAAFPRQLPQAR